MPDDFSIFTECAKGNYELIKFATRRGIPKPENAVVAMDSDFKDKIVGIAFLDDEGLTCVSIDENFSGKKIECHLAQKLTGDENFSRKIAWTKNI